MWLPECCQNTEQLLSGWTGRNELGIWTGSLQGPKKSRSMNSTYIYRAVEQAVRKRRKSWPQQSHLLISIFQEMNPSCPFVPLIRITEIPARLHISYASSPQYSDYATQKPFTSKQNSIKAGRNTDCFMQSRDGNDLYGRNDSRDNSVIKSHSTNRKKFRSYNYSNIDGAQERFGRCQNYASLSFSLPLTMAPRWKVAFYRK